MRSVPGNDGREDLSVDTTSPPFLTSPEDLSGVRDSCFGDERDTGVEETKRNSKSSLDVNQRGLSFNKSRAD